MKQTKKLTRNQREYLERKHIDTNCRVVEETNKFIKLLYGDSKIVTINKAE